MYLEISQLANVTAHVGLGENLMAPGVVKCPSLEQKNVLVVRWPTPMSVVLQSTAKAVVQDRSEIHAHTYPKGFYELTVVL